MAKSFFAYPSQPSQVAATIRDALKILHEEMRQTDFHGWEQNEIAGRFIVDPIFSEIQTCDFLAADITQLNFNVTYEIGYAIGRSRRIVVLKNDAYTGDDSIVREIGIYDTIGYKSYQDSRKLANILNTVSDFQVIHRVQDSINKKVPVYIVLPRTRTDREVHLISRSKKAGLFYRSFDPLEQTRLSAFDAIKNVATSYGVIAPLIESSRKDAKVHNIRAAFVAGLAHGMEKELLLLQFGDDPVPLDCLDIAKYVGSAGHIDEHLAEFAPEIMKLVLSDSPPVVQEPATFLATLNLGAAAAENEYSNLGDYYIETDEYRRVLRGEAQIVAGRKGSGKSAIFFRVRDKVRPYRTNVVLDLRPEGYQLRKFKDVVLAYLEQGTKEHVITAFWEYILLLEVCHKILENDKNHHITNAKLFQPYQDLAKQYRSDEYVSEGDFAERMLKLNERIIQDIQGTISSKKGRHVSLAMN